MGSICMIFMNILEQFYVNFNDLAVKQATVEEFIAWCNNWSSMQHFIYFTFAFGLIPC